MQLRWMAGAIATAWLAATAAAAQPTADVAAPAPFTQARIDALVAPIALYPDELLAAVLMAATYPDQVGEAASWRRANASLEEGELDGALGDHPWDPSVKSLVAFPRVLAMLDRRPAWTADLGAAFLADPAAVMDEVQRLRHAARAAGRLATNGEIVVTERDGFIDIAPANPDVVYVPTYDPAVAYGPWPFSDPPPPYDPTDFDDCVTGDFGYCWTASPVLLLVTGWDAWDWPDHRIAIDQARFTRLNGGRAPAGGDVWRHEAPLAPSGSATAAAWAEGATSVYVGPRQRELLSIGPVSAVETRPAGELRRLTFASENPLKRPKPSPPPTETAATTTQHDSPTTPHR